MRYKCDIKDEIYPFPSQCRHINLLLKLVTVGPVYPASRVSYDTATATSAKCHLKRDLTFCEIY